MWEKLMNAAFHTEELYYYKMIYWQVKDKYYRELSINCSGGEFYLFSKLVFGVWGPTVDERSQFFMF